MDLRISDACAAISLHLRVYTMYSALTALKCDTLLLFPVRARTGRGLYPYAQSKLARGCLEMPTPLMIRCAPLLTTKAHTIYFRVFGV